MKELELIEGNLAELKRDFNKQLEVLSTDSEEFHRAIIKLSAKYPEHQELLEFIVHINDKIELNQVMFREIVSESFNELIKSKQDLIRKMKDDKLNPSKSFIDTLTKKLTISDIKFILGFIAVILLSASIIISPTNTIETVKNITNITKKGK